MAVKDSAANLEPFVVVVEGEGGTMEAAFKDVTEKITKEVFSEHQNDWLPPGYYLNNGWINGEPSTPGIPAGFGFTERLLDGKIPDNLYSAAYGQHSGGEGFQNDTTGAFEMEYEYEVNPKGFIDILEYLLQGDADISVLLPPDPTYSAGAEEGLQQEAVSDDLDVGGPVDADVQDDRTLTEEEQAELPELAKAIIQEIEQDVNQKKFEDTNQPTQGETNPPDPPKTTVRLNPANYGATHVIWRDPSIYGVGPGSRQDETKLRSSPSSLRNVKKPWLSLKHKTLVRVVSQNLGKRGAYHEVEVISGDFAKDGPGEWVVNYPRPFGFVKAKFLRPLGEGLLAPVKEVASNTDLRRGQPTSVPSDWRVRKPGTPVLVVNQEKPWESTYEIVLRTMEKNFGEAEEKKFLDDYAAIGLLKILRFYNKDFKESAPTEEAMVIMLVESGFCHKVEWHLDSSTKNSVILVRVSVHAKKVDHYSKKLENFDFDKVREGDNPLATSGAASGTQEQIDAILLDTAGLPQISEPGIEKVTDLVPAHSLTCRYGDLKGNVESLKQILQYYKDLMNKDPENRFVTFPFGPVRGPLVFDKEIKNLDVWLGALNNFLANNEYDYKGEPCAPGTEATTPATAADADVLEFGWNSGYQLIYVLFNGFPLKIGIKYFAERSAFKYRRTNHFIHNSFDVEGTNTAKKIAASGGKGEALSEETGGGTKYHTGTSDDTEPADEVYIEKRGTVSEFKDPPDKRKPWTEWVLTHVYKDGIIRPSETKKETPNKTKAEDQEMKYGEGPYTEEEAALQEEKDKETEDKIEANEEAEKTTFETMDAFVQNIEDIVDQIEELEKAFQFLINKVGIGPLIDSLMACLMKQLPSVEEVMAKIGLEAIFKDTKKAIQMIGDILDSAPMECTLAVLNEALQLVYTEHPQQEIPGISDFESLTEKVAEEAQAAGVTDDKPKTEESEDEFVGPTQDPFLELKEDYRIVAIRKSSLKKSFPDQEKLKENWSIDYKFKNDSKIVKKWQQVLVDANLDGGDSGPFQGSSGSAYEIAGYQNQGQVDGIFGPRTEAATGIFLIMQQGCPEQGGDTYPDIPQGVDQNGELLIDKDKMGCGHAWVIKSIFDKYTSGLGSESTEGEDGADAAKPGSDPNAIIMKKGSRDKRKGLKNHVTMWQKFLVAEGFILLDEDSENYITGPRRWTGADAAAGENSHNAEGGTGELGIKEVKPGKYRYYYRKDDAETGPIKSTKFGIDGIFGWRTRAATRNWLIWAGTLKANNGGGAGAPWNALDTIKGEFLYAGSPNYKGEVTQAMYNMAVSFLEHKDKGGKSGSIDGLAGVDIANRVKFLGPRPPAGYYCRIGEPGPCDEIYSAIVKISRKIAIAEMMPTPTDLGTLMKKHSELKIEYVNCMKSAEAEPVIGEGLDHYAGKEQSENDQEKELATTIVAAEGKCDPKRTRLINLLSDYDPNGSGTEWPGTHAIEVLKAQGDEPHPTPTTGENLTHLQLAIELEKALQEYLECVNKEVTDKRQKLMESGGVALSSVTQIHPFPKNMTEAWMQFRKAGRFPTNVQINENFEPKDLWNIIERTPGCQDLVEDLINYLLSHVPPPTRTVLERLIQAAMSGAFAGLLPPVPEVPPLPDTKALQALVRKTYDPEGEMRQMFEDMMMKILTEIVTGLIKILVEQITEACAENEGAAENFGSLNASDIFSGSGPEDIRIPDFEALQRRLNDLQDRVNDYGAFDVQPDGSNIEGAVSYWEVLDELSKIFKPSQLCALFNGEASVIILAAAREFLDLQYPQVSMMLPTQDMLEDFFALLGEYADPRVCEDVRDGLYAIPIETNNPKLCIPDIIRDRKLSQCLDAGLTQEQCEEMLDRRADDNIDTMAKLANWPPEMPDMCQELADMKTNLPSVQAACRRILQSLVDQAVMIFNGETGYFIPALVNEGNVFDLSNIDAVSGLDALLNGDADSSAPAIASLCLGIAESLSEASTEDLSDMASQIETDFNKKSKNFGDAFKVDDKFMDQGVDPDDAASIGKNILTNPESLSNLKNILGTELEQFVANNLRKHLRTRETFTTDAEDSETTFKVPRSSKDSLVYNLPDNDYLIDSFGVKITENHENLFFNDSKFINELVEVYVKEQFPDWPPAPNETGPFTGETPPQLDLMKHILDETLLETGAFSGNSDSLEDIEYNSLYHIIKDDLIYKVRREISSSILFMRKEIEKLNLAPSTEEAKDECGIPLVLYGDVNVDSLLKPRNYLAAAIQSYNDAVSEECETGPPTESEDGPLQKAVAELVVRMMIRTFAVEMSLNSIFVLSKFRAKDSMYDKIILGYTLNTFKQDMLERKIYAKTKKVAQRIIRKRRNDGEIIPTNLRSGYECLKFLLREELKDVNLEFENIINSHPKLNVNNMPEWEKDGFAPHIILGGPDENIGFFPWNKSVPGIPFVNNLSPFPNIYPNLPGPGFEMYHYKKGASFYLPTKEDFDPISTPGIDHYKTPSNWNDAFGSAINANLGESSISYNDATLIDLSKHKLFENQGRRLATVIKPESLGFNNIVEAKKYYNIPSVGPYARNQIRLNDVIQKHGVFIWEPYLKIDEETYQEDLTPPGADKGQDPITEPHNNLLKHLIGIDYAAVTELGAPGQDDSPDIIEGYDKLTSQDFNWNYGLTGYVDILEYGEFIDRIRKNLKDFHQKTLTHVYEYVQPQLNQIAGAIFTYEGASLNEGDLAGRDAQWCNQALDILLQTYDGLEIAAEVTREDFIEWWSYYSPNGEAAAAAYWRRIKKQVEELKKLDGGEAGPGKKEILRRFINSSWEAYEPLLSDSPLSPDVAGTLGGGYKLIRPGRMLQALKLIVNGSPYYISQTHSTNGSYGYPVYRSYGQMEVESDMSGGGMKLVENINQPSNKKLQFNWLNGSSDGWAWKNIESPHQACPDDGFTYGYPVFGWSPAAKELLACIIKFIGLIGLPGSTAQLAEGKWYTTLAEAKDFFGPTMTFSKKLFKDFIGDDAEIKSMKWGLRLTYVFSTRARGIPTAMKEKLENIATRYLDQTQEGHIKYVGPSPINLGDENFSGGLSWSTLSEIPDSGLLNGAPKYVGTEITSADVFDPTTGTNGIQAPLLVHSIPLIEAEKDFRETSISNLPIYNPNLTPNTALDGEEPDKIWPGRWHQTFYQEVYEDLKEQITSSEKYAAIFDYTFPFRRYLGINSLNVIMAMKKIGAGPLMYSGTRDILTSMLRSAMDGTGEDSYSYQDPQLASLGDAAGMFSDSINSENFKPKKINLSAMVLKLFLETPFKILKGLVEAFDPNISLIKKIIDILKIIIEQLPEVAPQCIVEQAVFAAQQADPNAEVDANQIRADLDQKYKEIKKKLKDTLDNLPVPLISILMLPSMLPFGVGFPPPPFGFGIGPPLTPFGAAYLVLGLYRDANLMETPDMGRRDNPGDLANNLDPNLEALCKEKIQKYQEIAALGLIDAEPDEEDTD